MNYKVGIIGAMDEEVAILINKMTNKELVKKAGMSYYVGNLSGKDVIVVKCGIGKINAAVCSQILISEFNANVIINSGVAGALDNNLNIGDIVVGYQKKHNCIKVRTVFIKKRITFEKKGLAQAPFFCYIIKCCGMIAMKREVAAHRCRFAVERMSS